MVEEYNKYKRDFVRNIEFDPSEDKLSMRPLTASILSHISVHQLLQSRTTHCSSVQIYFDTATYDEIELGVKTTVEAQLGLIGGTMGLLTGFSVLSAVEIVYYGVKFFMSIWHSRANLH